MSDDGECILTRITDPVTGAVRVRVDRADPVIRIAPSLLDLVAEAPADGVTFTGGILRICGVNRTVIYRVRPSGEPACIPLYYIGEWPD